MLPDYDLGYLRAQRIYSKPHREPHSALHPAPLSAACSAPNSTCCLQACEEHKASKDAAQKLSFGKNKQVARLVEGLKRERAIATEAHAAVAAAAAAAVPPPTLLLGTLYGHELYGSLGGLELHCRAPTTTSAIPTRILSSCSATPMDLIAPRRDLPCEIATFSEEIRCASLNLVWEYAVACHSKYSHAQVQCGVPERGARAAHETCRTTGKLSEKTSLNFVWEYACAYLSGRPWDTQAAQHLLPRLPPAPPPPARPPPCLTPCPTPMPPHAAPCGATGGFYWRWRAPCRRPRCGPPSRSRSPPRRGDASAPPGPRSRGSLVSLLLGGASSPRTQSGWGVAASASASASSLATATATAMVSPSRRR